MHNILTCSCVFFKFIFISCYFAYVKSRLRYGIMFWGGDGKSIRIFRLQKKVIKLITGTHKRKSCRPIFRKFKILTEPKTQFRDTWA